MARRRTIKPEYFKDKVIASLGSQVGTVYQALWCTADDGDPPVARAEPDLLKGEMFTRWEEYTISTLIRCLQALGDRERIRLYSIGDELYAEIPTLHRHSRPNNPSPFRHPRGGSAVTDIAAFVAGQHRLVFDITASREPHGGVTGDSRGTHPPYTNAVAVTTTRSRSKEAEAAAAAPEADTYRVPTPSYLLRCVVALNTGLQANPQITHPREVPSSTQVAVVSWETDGIPIELAERIVRERAMAYQPTALSAQPRSLKYFDGAVREAWALGQQPKGILENEYQVAARRAREEEARAADAR